MWKTIYENLFIKPRAANSVSVHLQRGEYTDALDKANRLIEMDPNKGEHYRIRAQVKCAMQNYDGAISDCDRSLDLSGDDENTATCYIVRGMSRAGLGETSLALADFGRAISISSLHSLPAFIERGKLYVEQGDLNKALEDFSTALRFEISSSMLTKMELRMLRAEVYERLGDEERALLDLEKARFYRGNNPAVNMKIATLYNQKGDQSKAVEVLRQAMRNDPQNSEQYNAHLSEIAPQSAPQNAPPHAAPQNAPRRESAPVDQPARRAHPTERNPFAEEPQASSSVPPAPRKTTPNRKPASDSDDFFDFPSFNADSALNVLRGQHSTRAYNFAMKGDLTRALMEIDKAIAKNARNPQDHILRGNICLGLGRYDAALASFRTVQRLKTADRDHISAGMAGEALTLLHIDEDKDAREIWQSLVEYNPAFSDLSKVQDKLQWADASIAKVRRLLDASA